MGSRQSRFTFSLQSLSLSLSVRRCRERSNRFRPIRRFRYTPSLRVREMAVPSRFAVVVVVAVLALAVALPAVRAQSLAPAPAPSSDGTSIDQGIAYVLMLVALVLTYLIHSADISHAF